MKKLIILIILMLPVIARSQVNPEEIQRRQQQEMQDMLRQREIDAAKKAQEAAIDFWTPKEQDIGETEGCFEIKTMKISGVKKLSAKKVRKEVGGYLKPCMDKETLQTIQSVVQKMYVDKGYVGARVYFDFTEIKQKHLDIAVDEGFIENIFIINNEDEKTKDYKRNKLQSVTGFPFQKGKVLNLRNIEQGLDQINKLQSNNAVMDIHPGDKEGGSVIIINNNKGNTTQLSAGYDNSGAESTGLYKGNISLSQDNLISLNDNLFINASSTLWNNRDLRYSDAYTASLRIPFGYWTISDSFSYSKYLTTTEGMLSSFESTGESASNTFSVERMLFRGKTYKLSLGTQLAVKDNKNYLEDVFLDTSSRLITVGSLYLTGTYYSRFGSFFSKLTYNKGLDIFGSKKDEALQTGQPKAQFDSFNFYLNYSKDFWKVNYTNSVDIQYSADDLFSSEQMLIGGEGTIRGFKEGSISGEKGFYTRNDLRLSVAEFLGSSNNPAVTKILTQTYLGAFIDYGYVKPQTFGGSGTLAGAGAKISYYGNNLNGSFGYAKAIAKPDYFEDEGHVFYFNISLSLDF